MNYLYWKHTYKPLTFTDRLPEDIDPAYVWSECANAGGEGYVYISGIHFINQLSFTICKNPYYGETEYVYKR